MLKSNLMNNLLHYKLETPKALSTLLNIKLESENFKDNTMDNQQETKVIYFSLIYLSNLIFATTSLAIIYIYNK